MEMMLNSSDRQFKLSKQRYTIWDIISMKGTRHWNPLQNFCSSTSLYDKVLSAFGSIVPIFLPSNNCSYSSSSIMIMDPENLLSPCLITWKYWGYDECTCAFRRDHFLMALIGQYYFIQIIDWLSLKRGIKG